MSLPSTADPLLALRDATKSNTPITFVTSSDAPTESLANAAYILLGSSANGSEAKFSKSAPTRYSKLGAPHEFYTLEALYLAWALRALHGAEYMKQTREAGVAVGFVSVTERRGIVEWLEGQGAEDAGGRIAAIGVIGAQTRGNEAEGKKIAEFESTTPPGTPPPHSAAFASMSKSSLTKQHPSSTTTTTTPSKTPSSAYPFTVPAPDSPSKVDSTDSPTKRRYVADLQDIEVVKRIREQEVELKDRNTVLRGSKAGNFSALHTAYADKLKKMKESSKSHSSSGTNAYGVPNPSPSAGLGAGGVMQARKAKNMYPIIIISSSPTSLITMHNVKRFLQESTFELSSDARARAGSLGNSRAEDLIPIDRPLSSFSSSLSSLASQSQSHSSSSSSSQRQRYLVVDSAEALQKLGTGGSGAGGSGMGADAWDRVVCVMTTGQTWQFRPYKWAEPRALFHHVKGIYVSWANDPPNTKIKDWNVTELKIDPHRRHVDKSVVAHFWKILDDWMLANKPWLMRS